MLYNVIINGEKPDTYDYSQSIRNDRMFEYCHDLEEECEKFKKNGNVDFDKLKELPTIVSREFHPDDEQALARLGFLKDPLGVIKIENPLLVFPSKALMTKGILMPWENSRTHWTIRRGNPFELFYESSLNLQEVESQFTEPINSVFIAMPFTVDMSPVYDAIKKAVEGSEMKCVRVDEIYRAGKITDDIEKNLKTCKLVIADLSGSNTDDKTKEKPNPNVMYEVGLAHAYNKEVIFIFNGECADLPFDINHYRTISYSRVDYGLHELTEKLMKTISGTLNR